MVFTTCTWDKVIKKNISNTKHPLPHLKGNCDKVVNSAKWDLCKRG